MKPLPIGKQDFKELIKGDYLYIDKTEYIHQLITSGSYYFLSRPRRFGKSLFITTLREIFKGKKELFKGLYIYDKIEWTEHPVIHLAYNQLDYKEKGLRLVLEEKMDAIAEENNIRLKATTYSSKFDELIRTLGKEIKAVVLIDEYDKPIIDHLDNLSLAKENREILKNFYSIVKEADAYLRFFIITGVSKFSKVSVFSDLNHLEDITIDDRYSCLMGITQEEMENAFADRIPELQKKHAEYYPDILEAIKNEYLGYSWDGLNFVYNPFTLLNLFAKNQFGQYWFQSATPTFLMKLIKEQEYTIYDLENKVLFLAAFDKFEIEEISILSILFQTGYLTIKKFDIKRRIITLDFPNKEVSEAFSIHLLAAFNGNKTGNTNTLLAGMTLDLETGKTTDFMTKLSGFFKGISYIIADRKEQYFQSIFYTVLKLLGFNIELEVMTIDGRIDAVIKTTTHIYVVEFKTNSGAGAAIDQIRRKGYHEKYLDDKRPKMLWGIDFNTEEKLISYWKIEKA